MTSNVTRHEYYSFLTNNSFIASIVVSGSFKSFKYGHIIFTTCLPRALLTEIFYFKWFYTLICDHKFSILSITNSMLLFLTGRQHWAAVRIGVLHTCFHLYSRGCLAPPSAMKNLGVAFVKSRNHDISQDTQRLQLHVSWIRKSYPLWKQKQILLTNPFCQIKTESLYWQDCFHNPCKTKCNCIRVYYVGFTIMWNRFIPPLCTFL